MARAAPAELTRALLGAGLLSAHDVVERGVRVTERSRSHALHVVSVNGTRGLVLKRVHRAEEAARLQREAQLYAAAETRPQLRAVLPRRLAARPGWLALEHLEAKTLLEHHHHRGECPPATSSALGAALGSAHRALTTDPPRGFAGPGPWVLDAFEESGGAAFAWRHPQIAATLRAVPEMERVRAALAEARARWRPEHVIHGDLKWDNVLLTDPTAPEVRIVDWELAALGDPAWDLAGALQEYEALAVTRGDSPTALQAAASALWDGYAGATGLAARSLRHRAERLVGARLLQTACEVALQHGPHAPAVGVLRSRAVTLLTEPVPAA